MLGFVIGGSLLLYSWRAPRLSSGVGFNTLSRETLLLVNNVVLIVTMATILLGTLYPLIIDVLQLGKISVGPPYFNAVFIPMFALLIIVMGLGPHCYWKNMTKQQLWLRVRWLIVFALALTGFALLFIWQQVNLLIVLGLSLSMWLLVTTIYNAIKGPKNYGMLLAHLGVVITIIGITLTSNLSVQREVTMKLNQQAQVGPYTFQLDGVRNKPGPNYQAVQAQFSVFKKPNQMIATLLPERRFYPARKNTMTDAAINAGLWRDLYIALGEAVSAEQWIVRLYYKPFMRWVWLGGLLMLLGGMLAVFQRRKSTEVTH